MSQAGIREPESERCKKSAEISCRRMRLVVFRQEIVFRESWAANNAEMALE
jgi:hypothetical protein